MDPSLPLYVFIDESGNFDFSRKGTKFYTFTAVMTQMPFEGIEEITCLKHDVLSGKILSTLDTEYLENNLCKSFHATEDKQSVRDLFFGKITKMRSIKVNSIVIRKNRTNPVLIEPVLFYPKFLGSLLDYVFKAYQYSGLCIFVDGIAVNKTKRLFISTIKTEIAKRQPKRPYRLYFPSSTSHYLLQVTDYINWAIFKKWESEDLRSYDLIKHLLQAPELDIFRNGRNQYY